MYPSAGLLRQSNEEPMKKENEKMNFKNFNFDFPEPRRPRSRLTDLKLQKKSRGYC